MKVVIILFWTFCSLLFLSQAGCEQSHTVSEPVTTKTFAPAKVHILPLTEFAHVSDAQEQQQIKIYVSLLDPFSSQIKAPAIFRLELYEYVQRSSEPKGKRVAIWPDIDLTEPVENNKYWMDFLRAYEFNYPFEPKRDKSYMLQITCLRPDGRRLYAEFALKSVK